MGPPMREKKHSLRAAALAQRSLLSRSESLARSRLIQARALRLKDSLELIKVGSATEFSPGRFGILEPTGERRLAGRDQEKLVVFVPGVAFDLCGNRLGRGKAWYDRLIKRQLVEATLVALAYDFQIVDEVPAEEWDQRVHYVITERSVVDCRSMPVQSSQVS